MKHHGIFPEPPASQLVARPDGTKDQIVYKWPDATVPKFAQLTVEPDEVALFVREGRVAGTVGPGRSTLDAANIPFLGGLIDNATNGNFFKSEIYFVGTREFPRSALEARSTTSSTPIRNSRSGCACSATTP